MKPNTLSNITKKTYYAIQQIISGYKFQNNIQILIFLFYLILLNTILILEKTIAMEMHTILSERKPTNFLELDVIPRGNLKISKYEIKSLRNSYTSKLMVNST